jgi:hypothetical protein
LDGSTGEVTVFANRFQFLIDLECGGDNKICFE